MTDLAFAVEQFDDGLSPETLLLSIEDALEQGDMTIEDAIAFLTDYNQRS